MRDARALVHRTQPGTFARLVLMVLRVLAVLIAVQVSGFAPLAAELAAVDAGDVDGCCSDCPFEKDGQECPPSCPSCHCSHGGAALPAPAPATEDVAFYPVVQKAMAPPSTMAPCAPTLPSVYRPPRSLASA